MPRARIRLRIRGQSSHILKALNDFVSVRRLRRNLEQDCMERPGGPRSAKMAGHTNVSKDDVSDPEPDDPPAVLSPGDSDAPDAPDPDTVYPDEQGAPGEPDV